MDSSWRPTATLENLARRAEAHAKARHFFAKRRVLEVDTPALIHAPVSDVNLVNVRATAVEERSEGLFLHTSPEYAMKRLLAAGSGDIFQICRVYRGAERGRQHNPEFTMIEWYRLGFALEDLMREVAELVRELLGSPSLPMEFLTYREAVERHAGLDPLGSPIESLRAAARALGLEETRAAVAERDELLDLIIGARVGPALGAASLTFVHRYPASQAALARLDPNDPRVALRFELYHRGIELANGYHELASGTEQRQRFARDQAIRRARGLPVHPIDERFLAALDSGLPDCAGVALGFDRVLMLAMNASAIEEVLAFPTELA